MNFFFAQQQHLILSVRPASYWWTDTQQTQLTSLRLASHQTCGSVVSGCFAAHWPLKHKCHWLTHNFVKWKKPLTIWAYELVLLKVSKKIKFTDYTQHIGINFKPDTKDEEWVPNLMGNLLSNSKTYGKTLEKLNIEYVYSVALPLIKPNWSRSFRRMIVNQSSWTDLFLKIKNVNSEFLETINIY